MEESPRAVQAPGASAELDRPTQLHYLQRPLPQRPPNLATAFPDFAAAAGRSDASLVLPTADGMQLGIGHRFPLLRPGARQHIYTLPPMLPWMRENEEQPRNGFPFIRPVVTQPINMFSPILSKRREDDLSLSRGSQERPLIGPHGPQLGQSGPGFSPAFSGLTTRARSSTIIETALGVVVPKTSAIDKEVSNNVRHAILYICAYVPDSFMSNAFFLCLCAHCIDTYVCSLSVFIIRIRIFYIFFVRIRKTMGGPKNN